jgi:hypothetical protein
MVLQTAKIIRMLIRLEVPRISLTHPPPCATTLVLYGHVVDGGEVEVNQGISAIRTL